jgi:cell division transport system permease protein
MRSRFNFFFTEAIRSLTTNVATSVAATLSMLVALLVVGIFLAALFFVQNKAGDVSRDAGRVKVFLVDGVQQAQVNEIRTAISHDPQARTSTITFVSKQEALRRARKMFADTPELMANLPANPFPASLEFKLKDPSQVKVVAQKYEGLDGVKDVEYGGQKTEDVIRRAHMLQLVMLVLSIFLVISATVLVANTIRISINARQREITVMKLVGASNAFIRLPFMIEGFLTGLVAAIGAIVLMQVIGLMAHGLVQHFGVHDGEVPSLQIFGLLLVMGIALGGLGSGVTIRRFLRV